MSLQDKLKKMLQRNADKNRAEGESFLLENAKKENIITLPSGLQYEILHETDGEKPKYDSHVTCHYQGETLSGKIFDSSYKRNQPATFPLSQVINGWTEGLQLMAPGSKFKFYIPSHLAYGNRQVGADIGPNSTLIFIVELISFN